MSTETSITNDIIAVIVTEENKDLIKGGVPIFIVEDEQELEETSALLARITLGMVHQLNNGLKLIIRH